MKRWRTDLLVRSGLPIATINTVRKHLSAIKGGRLGAVLHPDSEAWILSDVPNGRPELVGSGPVCADPTSNDDAADGLDALQDPAAQGLARKLRSGEIPDTPKQSAIASRVLAENAGLVGSAAAAASARGFWIDGFGDMDDEVEEVAGRLASTLAGMREGALFIGGGEPTVRVTGDGRGGRCSELLLRLLRKAIDERLPPFSALIASSDGFDGNSGAAGYLVEWTGTARVGRDAIGRALARSDAHPVAAAAGEVLPGGATGNNLRDIILMARH